MGDSGEEVVPTQHGQFSRQQAEDLVPFLFDLSPAVVVVLRPQARASLQSIFGPYSRFEEFGDVILLGKIYGSVFPRQAADRLGIETAIPNRCEVFAPQVVPPPVFGTAIVDTRSRGTEVQDLFDKGQ